MVIIDTLPERLGEKQEVTLGVPGWLWNQMNEAFSMIITVVSTATELGCKYLCYL